MLGRISFREGWVNKELRNIWEKSCYHCIACFAPNLLAVLMWKWYLNSDFQPYSHPQRLQKCADGTSIKEISNLIYTWKAEMKEGKGVQKGRIPLQKGGSEKQERNHCVTKNLSICIRPREIYKNVPSSDLDQVFFFFKLFVLLILIPLAYCDLHSRSLNV